MGQAINRSLSQLFRYMSPAAASGRNHTGIVMDFPILPASPGQLN